MTIKDIIRNKNYDYIDIRVIFPENREEKSIFVGCCKSENGKLIPLDGDTYDESEIVVSWEEWKNEKRAIERGLTVIIQSEWI